VVQRLQRLQRLLKNCDLPQLFCRNDVAIFSYTRVRKIFSKPALQALQALQSLFAKSLRLQAAALQSAARAARVL
jgi:hypothetical protein